MRSGSEIVSGLDFDEMANNWVSETVSGSKDWKEWFGEVKKELDRELATYRAKEVKTAEEKKDIQKKVGEIVRRVSARLRGKK